MTEEPAKDTGIASGERAVAVATTAATRQLLDFWNDRLVMVVGVFPNWEKRGARMEEKHH